MVSPVWPNMPSSSITDNMVSMKSGLSIGSLSTLLIACSSTQLPTRVSNSLEIHFMDFTWPRKYSSPPKNGTRSETTRTLDTYMNYLIIFPILCASPSFPSFKFPKYLFPTIILVIMLKVKHSIHSQITTLAWLLCSLLMQRVYKSLIRLSTSITCTFFSVSSRRLERSFSQTKKVKNFNH